MRLVINSLSIIKIITYVVFVLIFICIVFIANHIFKYANLPINEILIKGEYQHIDRDQINLISNEYVQGNFFNINLYEARKAFKQLPWVRDVDLRRKWPDQLEVIIEEHKPIARWDGKGLVNDKGEIFTASTEDNLPIFMGPEDFVKEITIKFREINKILDKELIHISIIKLSERLSWEIKTNNFIRVVLGKRNVTTKVKRFIENYQFVLAELKSEIDYVDMRYRDGFSVRKTKKKNKDNTLNSTIL
ncbi:MAG: FtsQ-type POTRA domain-containing protein [Nitrosomonadales bacterium]|jgi:cell division protein FtsQ|nr:FtsQ-type POTRA domain-containing protein [Nitrosomonadales bacterium]